MKHENVTIKEIALQANVSHTTVSRALNCSSLVKPATKEKIKKLAEEMNYMPNYSAKSLVSKQSYNIGLYFADLTSTISPEFLFIIVQAVSRKVTSPFNLVIGSIDHLYESFHVSRNKFDGVILVSLYETDDKIIQKITSENVPLVVINRKTHINGVINLYCDDFEGITRAVNYLVENGHKDIGFLQGVVNSSANINRRNGFEYAMNRNNLTINDDWVLIGDFSIESGYQESKKLTGMTHRPTAIVSAADSMAFGFIRGLQEIGVKVPEDISIFAFENTSLSRLSNPSISCIGRPISKMSRDAIAMIFRILSKDDFSEKEKVYPVDLYIRESTTSFI